MAKDLTRLKHHRASCSVAVVGRIAAITSRSAHENQ